MRDTAAGSSRAKATARRSNAPWARDPAHATERWARSWVTASAAMLLLSFAVPLVESPRRPLRWSWTIIDESSTWIALRYLGLPALAVSIVVAERLMKRRIVRPQALGLFLVV